MNIINIKLTDIKPYENNPRNNKKAVEAVKNSIERFGWRQPIVVDKNNVIICGHTRYEAAMELGYAEAPCEVAIDMTDEDVKAYRLADNKVAELATWDDEKLIQELKDLSIDMSKFGFDLDFLNDIKLEETYEDNYKPKIPENPKSKLGDIYKLGNHRLMCGDCTNISDMQKLTEGKEMDLCVTDPPYNVNVGDKADYLNAGDNNRTRNDSHILNDDMSDESFYEFLLKFYKSMIDCLKEGGGIYIWHAESNSSTFRQALKEVGVILRQCLIWNKNTFVLSRQDYHWKQEPCLYAWKNGSHYFINDRKQSTVWEDEQKDFEKMTKDELIQFIKNIETLIIDEAKPMSSKEHPTMKPVKLIARCIKNSSRVGESVIDMFGGSGTTLIACEELKRNCYMMELDPHYVDVIIARWESLTGKKAVKLNGEAHRN